MSVALRELMGPQLLLTPKDLLAILAACVRVIIIVTVPMYIQQGHGPLHRNALGFLNYNFSAKRGFSPSNFEGSVI